MQCTNEFVGEKVWKHDGYYTDKRSDLNLDKVSFADNVLYCVNHVYLTENLL